MSEENTFDPAWIVELFTDTLPADFPHRDTILDSLSKCTHPVRYCSCGCGSPYFIDTKGPEWKFRTNVWAYKDHTQVILDIMDNWTVGSIEFLEDMPCDIDEFTRIEVD
jgi:hypothetical protein